MLTYSRQARQLLPPGAGSAHLRMFADLLAQTQSEAAEANHLLAGARVSTLQRRRALVVWMTDLPGWSRHSGNRRSSHCVGPAASCRAGSAAAS